MTDTRLLNPSSTTRLLGLLLANNARCYYDALEWVGVEDFFTPAERAIFRAIGRVAERGRPAVHLVWAELGEDRAIVEEAGGEAWLLELEALGGLSVELPALAQLVRREAVARRLRQILAGALESEEPDLDALQERLYRLARPERVGATLREAAQAAFLEQAEPAGEPLRFPWPEVQYCTRGLRPGWLCYLAGETSNGKTAAALAVTDHLLRAGHRVLYVTLEMRPEELAVRLAQRRGLDADAFYAGGRREDFRALLALQQESAAELLRIEQVQRVEQLPGLVRRYRPALVIVDYLQLLDIGRDTRLEGTARNSRNLKLLAQRLRVPVMCLSQLSRGGREEHGRPPGLWRLRDSGTLENDADQVIFVWRPRNDQQVLENAGKFIVAKARMGTCGAVDFTFDGARQEFILTAKYREQGWSALGAV